MSLSAPLWRDSNQTPVQTDSIISRNFQTLAGTGTVVKAIFRITGNVEVRGLYAVVTSDLGANQTACFYRLNDQTAQVNITLNTGVAISGALTGSCIVKKGLVGAALVYNNNSAGRVTEPTTLETSYFSPFVVTKKTGANTDIEFSFATTDNPTSGVLQHFLRWLPISADANVTAL